MPVTAYLDGSGTHVDSEILTLSACVMADELIEVFRRRWNEALRIHGLSGLHMREVGTWPYERRAPIERDILNLLGQFSQEFFYFRICSVSLADHSAAKRGDSSLRSPEELCVDHCVGGLAIPGNDMGRRDTVLMLFDPGEKFQRCIQTIWQRSRRMSGWPGQVCDIRCARSTEEPGLQVADLFAWATNRHLRRADRPEHALALMGLRARICLYNGNPDFKSRALNLRFGHEAE
jgi:hypothetical protein